MPTRDIAGERFGRLVAVRCIGSRQVGGQKKRYWLCVCDCGVERELPQGSLTCGTTMSCGCLLRDTITKHGAYKTKVYGVWHAMLDRCRCSTNESFRDYGGRGITVCDRWLDFQSFLADMGDRPEGGTLERIDVNGHYCPENCRWATQREQGNNRRNNLRLTANGRTQTLAEWAAELGVPKSSIRYRLARGASVEDALFKPRDRSKRHEFTPRRLLRPEQQGQA